MESLIIALIALLILLPVLYFLPLGFTKKGKVLIVVASFLTGLFGLAASLVVPLWQTGLILFLLVIIIAYLFNKQGENWLYLPEEVYVDPFLEKVEQTELPEKEMKDTYTYIASSDHMPKEEKVKAHVFGKKNGNNLPLEKLVPESEKDLTHFPKANDKEDAVEDIEINELQPINLLQSSQEPMNRKDLISNDNQIIAEPKKMSSEDLVNSELDIEELPHEDFIPNQEMESSAPVLKDSYGYMADLEKMLDIDELSMDGLTPVPTEKAVETKLKKNDAKFELEELDNLEELIFPKQEEPHFKEHNKEKKQEQSVEDHNTVKQ